MKLASYTESHLAKRLSLLLVKKGQLIGFALFCLGLLSYGVLLRPENLRYRFFDENALLTGLVKREFRNGSYLMQLSNQYGDLNKNSVSSWIGTILERSGFEVYHHNFSTHQIKGSNVYGILRAGRSSSTEALLLSAPISLGVNEEKNFGIVILLGLADYLSSRNYWAKDIIILVTSHGIVGAQAWLDAYLGINNPSIKSETLTGRSGVIQFVINLEVAINESISLVNIIPDGINAILPNLDLVFVASKLCELEGMDTGFHTVGLAEWQSTLLSVLSHQATGLPFNNHALFLKHRIDSLTLQVLPSFKKSYSSSNVYSLARSIEGILRTLNNLMERLHHSEFFYIMTSSVSFLSIGQYSPLFSFLVFPLILESLCQWIMRNNNNLRANLCQEKLSIPPLLNIPLKPLLILLVLSIVNGLILYKAPSFFSLSSVHLTVLLMTLCVLMILQVMLIRPTYTIEELCVTRSIVLFIVAIGLYGLSLVNFALSLVLTIFYSLPLSYSTSRSALSKIVFLVCSPPSLVGFSCMMYCWIFTKSSDRLLESSLVMVTNGLQFAYNSHVLSDAWLYPFLTLLVFPLWWLFWVLCCANVAYNRTEKEHLQ